MLNRRIKHAQERPMTKRTRIISHWSDKEADLAIHLFEVGAVQIDTQTGFELAEHRVDPQLPLSPIKFNIRTKENGGTLTEQSLWMISSALADKMQCKSDLPTILIGAPNAGTKLVSSLREYLSATAKNDPSKTPAQIVFEKRSDNTAGVQNFIGHFPGGAENKAWLVDDVLTRAHTKLRSLDTAFALGFMVKKCLVLIDREQGGKESLLTYGVETCSVFTVSDMLTFYNKTARISDEAHEKIKNYLITSQ